MTTIGGIKYEGALVADGIIDAEAAARALTGIDHAFQYFIGQENPTLGSMGMPLPVEIKKGSWEALIPSSILGWIGTVGTASAATYITVAAKKLAENGFKDETITSISIKALALIQELVKIGKHLGHLELKKVTNVRWEGKEIIIPNESGGVIRILQDDWNKLAKAPINLLSGIASVIEEERALTITVTIGGITSKVTVTKKEKHIFSKDIDDDDDILFPDLIDGLGVSLEGIVTRENGRSRTLGFLYKNHVITCLPASGNMLPYKKHLYLTCRMGGTVSRIDESGQPNAKKPKIIFRDLEIISNQEQLDLEGMDDNED